MRHGRLFEGTVYGFATTIVVTGLIFFTHEAVHGLLQDWTGLTAGIRRGSNVLLTVGILAHLVTSLALIALAVLPTGASVAGYVGWQRRDVKDALLGIGLIALVHVAYVVSVRSLLSQDDELDIAGRLSRIAGGWPFPLLTLLAFAGVFSPVFEEALFRGFLWRGLEVKLGSKLTLVVVSLAFAVAHGPVRDTLHALWSGTLPDPFRGLTAVRIAVDGMIFGWLRCRSGGISAPMIAHFVANTMVVGAASSGLLR